MAPRRYCAWAIWALGAAHSSGGADVMPYRDVQPQRESPENLWLATECGMMLLSPEQARAKSELLANTANAVRAILS